MKTTKKVLSVLLAVIMMVSSMSVCFGTVSFAADGDAFEQLAEALKSDTVKNIASYTSGPVATKVQNGTEQVLWNKYNLYDYFNTTTITLSSYAQYVEIRDLLILLDNAIKATDEYTSKAAFANDGSTANCTDASEIQSEILTQIVDTGKITEAEVTSYKVSTLLGYVLCMTNVITHGSNKSNKRDVPNKVENKVIVKTTDYKGYLAQVGKESNVAATINLGHTYTFTMTRENYTTGTFGTTNHYHNAVNINSAAINAPTVYTDANNTTVKTELNAYVSYIKECEALTFEDMLAKVSAGTIDTFLEEFADKKAAMITYVGSETTFNALFADYLTTMENIIASANSAIEFQDYLPIVDNWKAFVSANPNYGVFNWGAFGEKGSETHQKLLADYDTFMVYYNALMAGGDIVDYFVEKGEIDLAYQQNFYDNKVAYNLNDTKADADALYAANKDTYKDLSTEDQVLVYSELTGYINAIGTYSAQVQNAIFPDGWQYLLDLQEELYCETNSYVLYFAENADKDFSDYATEKVWEKIEEVKEQLSGLNALYSEVTNRSGADRAAEILGTVKASADAMLANLYKLLGDRFTAEVENAYAKYVELGKPKELDVSLFIQLNSVLSAIEHDIITDLDAAGQGAYITSDTRAKYNELNVDIIPVYDAYRTTYGFNDYEQTQITYEDRELYANDQVKTETYEVTEQNLLNVISDLDTILNSDTFASLIGQEDFDLGAMLSDLIKDALFTDATINSIVQLLYPLVAGEFEKVWSGLPKTIEYEGLPVAVNYSKDLYDVFNETGFNAYPDLMAKSLDSEKYADNIAKLTAAKQNWESAAIMDIDSETLTLTWGVDEAKERLENGEITEEEFEDSFYQAFEDAMTGIYPLLAALVSNQAWNPVKVNNLATARVKVVLAYATLDIHLQLGATANSGYANLLVPIYEALGLTAEDYTPVADVEKSTSIAYVFEAILSPLFTFFNKLGENPVDTILGILPNLVYALSFNMVPAMLNMLHTDVTYKANATGIVNIDSVMNGAANIYVGDLLKLEDLGLNLSGGLNTLISGFGLNIPEIDQATVATLGSLEKIDTGRKAYIYSGLENSGKAYTIKADKADVGYYLLTYILKLVKDEDALTSLLSMFMTQKDENGDVIEDADGNAVVDEEAIASAKEIIYGDEGLNLDEMDVGDAIAAIVELANQVEYPVDGYVWYAGNKGTPDGITPASEIYLSYDNDWNKEKATYLYEHLDDIVNGIIKTAGSELVISDELTKLIGDLYTNVNITAIAKGLSSLELDQMLIDVLKAEVGVDLGAFAQYKYIADDYNWGFTDGDSEGFADAFVSVLAPFAPALDFIFKGEDLELIDSAIVLHGYKGYDNAIVPLLEALGCDVKTLGADDDALEVIVDTLLARIDKLAADPLNEIIELLPGVLYYLASGALSQGIDKLLQPVYVVLDTIRPIYDLDLNELIADLTKDLDFTIDLNNLDIRFVVELVNSLTGLNLADLETLIYDVCKVIGVEYDSVSTLESTWKKGVYSTSFDQADMLTVILSFVLEWITVEENAKALDEMLGTDGIIDALDTVFADIEITYGTPDWMYWFSTQEEFDAYVNGGTEIPSTLAALTYPNDWTDETAQYLADNITDLVDTVVGLTSEDYDTLASLIEANVNVFTTENLQALVELLTDLLKDIDSNLLDAAGRLLDVDIVGLTAYTAPEGIDSASEFATELANVLTTYANGLVEWLFLGNDYRFAKKSDNTDTIVINGGEGYAEGLALILEALDCKNLPAAEGDTKEIVNAVLASLAGRIEEILANPVEEVLDLLPNLVYFLNANGAGVAVDNLLQPVYALLEKLSAFGVELDLDELLGFELKDLSLNAVLTIVEEKIGLDLSMVKEILVDFCVGKIVSYDSVSVNPAYKMTGFSRKDVITLVATIALLVVENEQNAAKLDELIGTEIVSALKSVFESTPVSYVTPDWDYCWAEDGIDYDNATVEVMEYAITYPNNWTEESAKYVADNLGPIADMIAGLIDSNYSSLADLINDKVTIYSTENVQAIVDAITGLLGDIDAKLLEAAGILLDVDLNGLKAYKAPEGIDTAEEFAAELTKVLTTYANGVVEWLFLGKDFRFFVDDANADGIYGEGEDIITINGGHGYAEGLALVLEALGCENLPAAYDTDLTTEEIVSAVLSSTFARVDEILADPVTEVFDLLPNLLYFLNANGVAAAIDNLLGAVNALLVKLEAFGVEVDINSLINIEELLGIEKDLSISLDNLTIAAILELVSELTGFRLTALEDVLVGFALGEVKAYASVSRTDITYKMYYHDDFAKYDMITVLATCVIMAVEDDANADKLKELLGEDVYQVILNIFNMGEVPVQEFDWKFTDKADTGYAFSAINTSELYENHQYGPLYTEEMAQYIADNIGEFIDNVIYLLGISINGTSVDSLKELINEAVNGSLYNSANVIAIRDALVGVLKGIGEMEGGEHIKAVLKTSLGVDIDAVANVNVPEFEEDRAKFTKYLCEVLEPLYPVLEWVLADEDIAFFVDENKDDAIKLFGAEGYAYGIIPLLEVLECENILTPAEYYAAVEADGDVVLTAILNPLLDRVDVIMEDPAEAILSMLPNLIYFINSNGVDTVVKNTLNAVYALLNAIEPIAKIDLYELIGLDLSTLTFEKLFEMALDMIADATGYEFSALDANAIAELTVGTLVSYTSKNGKTAYKMVYQSEGAKAEMVTVVMRLIVTFIMHENNREMLLGLLRDYLNMNEDAEKYIRSVLDLIATCAVETYLGMDKALATLYYIFYGTDIAVGETANGLKDVNAKWQQILKDMGKSDDPNEATLGNALADFLDTYFEDVITSEGIAPNGFIAFFQKIIDWFKSIIEWFKNLFS